MNVLRPDRREAAEAWRARVRAGRAQRDRLREAAGIPLVLHGGSGIRKSDVMAAVRHGVAKINIATARRQASPLPKATNSRVRAGVGPRAARWGPRNAKRR